MYSVIYKGFQNQYTSTIDRNGHKTVTAKQVYGLIRKSRFTTQQAAEDWVTEQGNKITPLSIVLDWDEEIQCGRKVKAY